MSQNWRAFAMCNGLRQQEQKPPKQRALKAHPGLAHFANSRRHSRSKQQSLPNYKTRHNVESTLDQPGRHQASDHKSRSFYSVKDSAHRPHPHDLKTASQQSATLADNKAHTEYMETPDSCCLGNQKTQYRLRISHLKWQVNFPSTNFLLYQKTTFQLITTDLQSIRKSTHLLRVHV